MRKVTVSFFLQCMSRDEFMPHIPADEIEEAKREGDKFEVYRVAHPGETLPYIPGKGNVRVIFKKPIIQFLKKLLRYALPVFFDHNDDNSHEGRTPIGKVVSWFQKGHDLFAIVRRAAQFLHKKADVASFEMTIDMKNFRDGHEIEEREIQNITGLALGSSETDTPAFPRAIKEGEVQFMCSDCREKTTALAGTVCMRCLTQEVTVTLEEMRNAIRDGGFTISDLFPDFRAQVKSQDDEHTLNHRYQVNRLNEEKEAWKAEAEKIKKEAAAALEEQKKLRGQLLRVQAGGKLPELFEKRPGLDEKQKKYLTKKMEGFAPDPEKDLDGQLDSFLNERIQEYDKEKLYYVDPAPESDKKLPEPVGAAERGHRYDLPV